MGQKVSPISFRINFNQPWLSRWFGLNKRYTEFFREDYHLRQFLAKRLKNMGVDKIEIERSPNAVSLFIYTARPGLIIGRGGSEIESLKKAIQRIARKKTTVHLEVLEFKNPETSASIVAELMVEQIEKRLPYRRVLKQALAKIIANQKEVKGAKVELAGRLDGNEIARTEHLEEGSLPLQTLRANISYAKKTAHTTYGTVGVKVWIYKGIKFKE